jgi:hypothetical protein
MRKYLASIVAIAASLAFSGCVLVSGNFDSGERYTSDFRYSYPLNPGASFSIENFNGAVEIGGWDQNTVEITGSKYARTEALRDEIRIEIAHSDNAVSIRTIHPMDLHGNMGARYVIRVPRKVQLDRVVSTNGSIRANDLEGAAHLRTSNGSIHVGHLQGNVEAQTTNGSIEAEEIDGAAHLHTSNGHVRADGVRGQVEATSTNGGVHIHESSNGSNQGFRLSTSNGPIELTVDGELKSDVRATTTNGSITLHLPSSTAARVSASTIHERITSDFDVTMQGHIDGRHLEGAINGAGSGSPTIDLTTSNGHIRLLKM